MSVISETSSAVFNGSGSTGPFSFTFRFAANGDLTVKRIGTDGVASFLTLDTDYTVSGAGNPNGGSVTLITALAVGEQLQIYRNTNMQQGTVFRNQGAFYPETHEDALDKLAMITQDLDRRLSGAEDAVTDPWALNPDIATLQINGGVVTINLETANVFKLTLTENVSLVTITNPPVSGRFHIFSVHVVAVGNYTLAWPALVKWADGLAPAPSTVAGWVDTYSMYTIDGGATWYASVFGLGFR